MKALAGSKVKRWKRFAVGFRHDFMVSYDNFYYDGEFRHLNLGWVWFAWNLDGLPYLFQDHSEDEE